MTGFGDISGLTQTVFFFFVFFFKLSKDSYIFNLKNTEGIIHTFFKVELAVRKYAS